MYNQITENKTKSALLITLFMGLLIGLGYLFGRVYDIQWLLPFAIIWSVIQAATSYYFSDQIALSLSGAKQIEKKDAPQLYRMVENLAITAGLPTPRIYIINDTAINAFATGRDPQHAAIAVTRGTLERLENEEQEGVLAHELSHIGNYDIRLSSMVVVLVGVLAMLSHLFLRSLWWRGDDRDDRDQGNGLLMLIAIVFALLSPLVATLIQLAISRKREYLADASGALLTRYPEGLARALEKIAADTEPLEVANQATAHLYIANPLKDYGGAVNNLFSTHPPVKDRIRRLRNMA